MIPRPSQVLAPAAGNVDITSVQINGFPFAVMYVTEPINPGGDLRYNYGTDYWSKKDEKLGAMRDKLAVLSLKKEVDLLRQMLSDAQKGSQINSTFAKECSQGADSDALAPTTPSEAGRERLTYDLCLEEAEAGQGQLPTRKARTSLAGKQGAESRERGDSHETESRDCGNFHDTQSCPCPPEISVLAGGGSPGTARPPVPHAGPTSVAAGFAVKREADRRQATARQPRTQILSQLGERRPRKGWLSVLRLRRNPSSGISQPAKRPKTSASPPVTPAGLPGAEPEGPRERGPCSRAATPLLKAQQDAGQTRDFPLPSGASSPTPCAGAPPLGADAAPPLQCAPPHLPAAAGCPIGAPPRPNELASCQPAGISPEVAKPQASDRLEIPSALWRVLMAHRQRGHAKWPTPVASDLSLLLKRARSDDRPRPSSHPRSSSTARRGTLPPDGRCAGQAPQKGRGDSVPRGSAWDGFRKAEPPRVRSPASRSRAKVQGHVGRALSSGAARKTCDAARGGRPRSPRGVPSPSRARDRDARSPLPPRDVRARGRDARSPLPPRDVRAWGRDARSPPPPRDVRAQGRDARSPPPPRVVRAWGRDARSPPPPRDVGAGRTSSPRRGRSLDLPRSQVVARDSELASVREPGSAGPSKEPGRPWAARSEQSRGVPGESHYASRGIPHTPAPGGPKETLPFSGPHGTSAARPASGRLGSTPMLLPLPGDKECEKGLSVLDPRRGAERAPGRAEQRPGRCDRSRGPARGFHLDDRNPRRSPQVATLPAGPCRGEPLGTEGATRLSHGPLSPMRGHMGRGLSSGRPAGGGLQGGSLGRVGFRDGPALSGPLGEGARHPGPGRNGAGRSPACWGRARGGRFSPSYRVPPPRNAFQGGSAVGGSWGSEEGWRPELPWPGGPMLRDWCQLGPEMNILEQWCTFGMTLPLSGGPQGGPMPMALQGYHHGDGVYRAPAGRSPFWYQ
eukprot:jgi/Botrbrau1/3008/Bobra.0070s0006.1